MTGDAMILAVDGGNSKTDLALVNANGSLSAFVRGPTISHQQVPFPVALERLTHLADEARRDAGADGPWEIGVFCLAGADFASDLRALEREIGGLGLVARLVVRNDAFAALRAGAPSGWGIVLVCGAGVNAVGTAPDGRRARLPAVGDISGDWGGGQGIGLAALGAAVRARDGRGPATSLARLVPAHFGLGRPIDVTRAVYDERLSGRRLEELAPLVFEAAAAGDPVARGMVDRLADELAVMATAIARRLRLARREVDVVLSGGVFRTSEPGFYARLGAQLRAGVPGARLVRLASPPVLGAALLGLDELGVAVGGRAESRLREAIEAASS